MPTLDIQEIMRTLPHRYPMLLVDRILECDDEKRIVGIKNLTFNEPFFQGHFPDFPVMPGVLQLEAMAQVGGILLIRKLKFPGGTPLFLAVDNAKFRKMVSPGDQLRIEVDVVNFRSRTARIQGKAFVGEQLASEAVLLFMLAEQKVKA